MKPDIAIIGPGRVGQSIGRLLCDAGYPVSAVVGRDTGATRAAAAFVGAEFMATSHLERCRVSRVIFLTVPDDNLPAVIENLCHVELRSDALLIHCSGLHTTEIFTPLRPTQRQLHTLALHPLQTFASPTTGYEALPGSYCSLQGEVQALERGHTIVTDLNCRGFIIHARDKVRYHAAACMVSNYVTALIDAACELCADMSSSQVLPAAFAPLIQAAINNTLKIGSQQALTGPVVRADIGTLSAHLSEIRDFYPQILPLYRAVASHAITLAAKGGRLDDINAKALRDALE